MEYFASIENILWLIWLGVGVGFILLELAVPAFIVVFFGVGAIIAGITALMGFTLQTQIVVFGVSSLALIILLRKVMASTFSGSSVDESPEDADHAIGAKAEVVEAIAPPQRGRVKYQGTFWAAEAAEALDEGTIVRIVERSESDRNIFTVEKEN